MVRPMDWWTALVMMLGSTLASEDLRWAGVLSELDDVRAEAFASSDPGLLDRVYAPGSKGREADAAVIRDYERRGGQVTGADLIVLSCQVKDVSTRRVRLAVVDRLTPVRVVWADGTSRALPRDLPTKRTVTLVRTDDGWRID